MATQGKPIQCKAAVIRQVNTPYVIETVQVAPPKKGQVRFKVVAAGVCHSDLSGTKGYYAPEVGPCIMGHEGAGIVESVGEGVTSVKAGDHVIAAFNPYCTECDYCKSPKTNYCTKLDGMSFVNTTMEDGSTPFSNPADGTPIYGMARCTTFSQYTVMPEYCIAKVDPAAPLDKVVLFSCCVSTGYGAARDVDKGSRCAVWGMGAVGLSAVMACKAAGAKQVVGIDVNPAKKEIAMQVGCTDFLNPTEYPTNGRTFKDVLMEMSGGEGFDYTFECIGVVDCISLALDVTRKGWGKCVLVGIPPLTKTVPIAPISLIQGRTCTGTFFGGIKGRKEVPTLVDDYVAKRGNLQCLDKLITKTMPLDKVNEAFDDLVAGKSIRTVLLPWSV